MTGYGCVQGAVGRERLVEAGVFRLVGTGEAAPSVASRLGELDRDLRELLERVRPEAVGVEALFSHYRHPATAVVMGHARGVLLLAAQRAGVRIVEVRPAAVKKSLIGHGAASKEQMQRAIQARFGLAEPPRPHDVADALAVALYARGRLAGEAVGV